MLDRKLFEKLEENRKFKAGEKAFDIYEGSEYFAFKRMKIKDNSFAEYADFSNVELKNIEQKGVSKEPKDLEKYKEILAKNSYGVSDKHRALSETFYNVFNYIEVEKNTDVKEPIFINMTLDEDNEVLLDNTMIVAHESSSVTVAIHYKGDIGENNAVLNVFAEDNAQVNVIVLQSLGDEVRHYHSAFSTMTRDAKVLFTRIDLGAKEVITDYSSYMEGIASESRVESIYFGSGESKLDISYRTYHKAIATQSEISVNGALKDKANKVFRGDLYFEREARKSEGREEEFVILLDDSVKAHSIPALLCDEDDVIGEHAASAGQIDENKLFYLMSRGFSKEEAKKTIVLASYEKALACIPNDDIREDIKEIINEKMNFS